VVEKVRKLPTAKQLSYWAALKERNSRQVPIVEPASSSSVEKKQQRSENKIERDKLLGESSEESSEEEVIKIKCRKKKLE
jgi:hypothetical protein